MKKPKIIAEEYLDWVLEDFSKEVKYKIKKEKKKNKHTTIFDIQLTNSNKSYINFTLTVEQQTDIDWGIDNIINMDDVDVTDCTEEFYKQLFNKLFVL